MGALQVAAAENFVSKNLSEVRKPSALLSSIIRRYAEGGDVPGHDGPGGVGGGYGRCAAPGSQRLPQSTRLGSVSTPRLHKIYPPPVSCVVWFLCLVNRPDRPSWSTHDENAACNAVCECRADAV